MFKRLSALAFRLIRINCLHLNHARFTMMLTVLKYLWALPNTLLGMVFVPLALVSGGKVHAIQGALEIHGGMAALFLTLCRASGMTIGHVILGKNARILDDVRLHEHVHIRQYERWGILFLPAYFLSSIFVWLRGKHPYYDNPFEKEAFEKTAFARL